MPCYKSVEPWADPVSGVGVMPPSEAVAMPQVMPQVLDQMPAESGQNAPIL